MALAKRFYHNKPLTILDIPATMQTEALGLADPETPIGARGVGEPPVGAGYGSVMNAIADAVGEEVFRRAPVTADIVLMSLEHGRRMHEPLASHSENEKPQRTRRTRMKSSLRSLRSSRLHSDASPTENVAFAPHVSAAAQRTALRIDADRDNTGAHAVWAEHVQPVAARGQLVAHRLRDAIFDFEHTRVR